MKLLFKKEVEVKEYFIVYNSQTKNIDYIEAMPTTKEESSYLILFSMASILLMLISNVLFKKGYDGSVFAFSAAVATALVALFANVSVFADINLAGVFAVLAGVFAVLAAAFAFFVSLFEDEYKVLSIIYYILMAIHLVLLFVRVV